MENNAIRIEDLPDAEEPVGGISIDSLPDAAPVLAVDPSAVSNQPPRAALVASSAAPAGDASSLAQALGYGTARSVAPALVGGAAATAIGAGLTATGVGAPIGIPLSILGAMGAGFGTRYVQDEYVVPPSDAERAIAAQHPTAYNTIPAVVTMPLGGGRFGVQNIKDLGTAVSAASAGRALTAAEKAAAISAGTQVGVNAAIPAGTRAYNVSQGGEFGLGDYLIEAGAAPFVGGKSYRPVQATQDVAATLGFKAGTSGKNIARSVGQKVGVVSRPTAQGEINVPPTVVDGVELVMPEGFNPRIWSQLTDQGRKNAIADWNAAQTAAQQALEAERAAAAAKPEAQQQAPAPTQETLPVTPAPEATQPAPAVEAKTTPAPVAETPAPVAETPATPEPQRPATVKPQDWDGMSLETKRLIAAEAADEAPAPVQPEAAAPVPEPVPAPEPASASPAGRSTLDDAVRFHSETDATNARITEAHTVTPEVLSKPVRVYRGVAAGREGAPSQNAMHGKGYYYSFEPQTAGRYAENRGSGSSIEFGTVNLSGKKLLNLEALDRSSPEFKRLTQSLGLPDDAGSIQIYNAIKGKFPSADVNSFPANRLGEIARAAGYDGIVSNVGESGDIPAHSQLMLFERPSLARTGEAASAPSPKTQQTEIAGAKDTFNLAGDKAAPTPEAKPADTTPDLIASDEPAYVGPARKRLADLEGQGKGNSPEAVGLREVIAAAKPKPAETPAPKPAEAVPAPEAAAPVETPAPKPKPAKGKAGQPAEQAQPQDPARSSEPTDIQRARKVVADGDARRAAGKRTIGRKRTELEEARAKVEQYELEKMAADPEGSRLDDAELAKVSEEALDDFAQGVRRRQANGEDVSKTELDMAGRYEKELLRREKVDRNRWERIEGEEGEFVRQGLDAIKIGRYFPTLPKQYKAEQIRGYKENMPRGYRGKKFFRRPPGIKIKDKPTVDDILEARARADRMIADLAESIGSGNPKWNDQSATGDEIINRFIELLNKHSDAEGETGFVGRRYEVDEPAPQDSPAAIPDEDAAVAMGDEAPADAPTDAEAGSKPDTDVDPADATLAGLDETPANEMPPHLDDGQGGKTLDPKDGEGGILDKLDKAADDILGPEDNPNGKLHSPTPSVLGAMVYRTARAMGRGLVDVSKGFATWSKDFVRKHGAAFKAYAQYVWDAAKNTYQSGFVNFKPRFLAGIAEKANQVADRNEQSQAAKEVAALIFNRPGAKTAGGGAGAPMQVEGAQARVANRLADLAVQFRDKISQMSDSERAMFNTLVRRIHQGEVPMPKGWVGDFVKGMRDMLRNDPDAGLLAQKGAGVEIGDVGETYLPRNLDPIKVKAREAEFKKAAAAAYKKLYERLNETERLEMFPELGGPTKQEVNDAFFEAQAEAYFNRATERVTDGDLLPLFGDRPSGKASVTKQRTFNDAEARLLESFYTNDYLGDIERYLASAARRKVTAEAIGPNGEKLADLSQRMAAEGVDADDRRELRELLKKAMGIGREQDAQSAAAFFDTTGFVQGAVMLGRSFWNNLIQEPAQIGVRASRMPLGIDAPVNILKAYKQTYTEFLKNYVRLNPEQTRAFRNAMGKDPAFAQSLDQALSEELGLNNSQDPSFYVNTTGDFATGDKGLPALRRLTGKLFDLNLLSPTEAAKVTASVGAARRFILGNLRFAAGDSPIQQVLGKAGIDVGGQKVARLQLAELGIKEADIPDVLAFARKAEEARSSGDNDGYVRMLSGSDPIAKKYRDAIYNFSRQSSVKPSRATKPEFQDQGLGRLFLQLKGFSYDFEQSINLRRWGLMKEAVTAKNWSLYDRAVMAGPLLWMPATVALTAAKFAIVNALYPSEGTKRRDKEGVVMKGLDAGSYEGAFGPFFETLFKQNRQQTPIGGAAGQVATDLSRAGINAATSQSNTNGPERQIARTGYRNVVKPAVAAASTLLPKPAGVAVNLGMGATQLEEKFVDETAGKDQKGKKSRGF